jgi:HEAT repeat protein
MLRLDGSRAIANVARLETDRNVPGLVHELDNPLGRGYRAVRLHAVLALSRLGDPRAAQYVVPLASDESPVVRAASLAALGTLGHEDAVPMLLAGLSDSASIVRGTSAEQLGEMGAAGFPAVPRLRDLVAAETDTGVRATAARALFHLGENDIAAQIPALVGALPWWKRRGAYWKKLVEDARLAPRLSEPRAD